MDALHYEPVITGVQRFGGSRHSLQADGLRNPQLTMSFLLFVTNTQREKEMT
jgi:hypothetical protein